ncbi:MAG: S8 family serine peptidase, partial [Lentimicrobiaceae bacterium]|nr:S8 family serine peptidase [Lentimicrobiaceae bacterium]
SLQGEYFVKNNINGKGVRIAVFDGGFPKVDTHEAFEHLRKNNQIVNTWNFPIKKEDVYGWNSHGTMVLSCIAGIKKNGTMLGLATGAEFLLARTEVETEPKKEEFWWLQAVEWADKNGANVINSSLGYGIDRHYFEELDGKTTIVTKAANMAASKGILVCNAAGNEGSDRQWLKIIAPADADSILTVGGINASLTHFSRINFSSYGPTADGRMKPNVAAFGYANVASPSKNYYRSVHGTSFSSPLIAGFAACAWQTNRNLTAMELKDEIEKSASLYPYFDYAYGYGTPKASYFTENQQPEIERTFTITSNDTAIIITPIADKLDFLKINYLFYNVQDENGTLDYYTQIDLYQYYTTRGSENYDIVIKKHTSLNNKTLNVFLNGYFESYKIEETERYDAKYTFLYARSGGSRLISVNVQNQKPSKWGYKAKHFMTGYVAYSMFLQPSDMRKEWYDYGKSRIWNFGVRYKYNVNKWYAIGGNLEYGVAKINDLRENYLHLLISLPPKYNKWVSGVINLEFFQRFNLGVASLGSIYLDLGIYGSASVLNKQKLLWDASVLRSIQGTHQHQSTYKEIPEVFGYGVRARLGYGFVAMFAQYGLANNVLHSYYDYRYHADAFSLGIELSIPW